MPSWVAPIRIFAGGYRGGSAPSRLVRWGPLIRQEQVPVLARANVIGVATNWAGRPQVIQSFAAFCGLPGPRGNHVQHECHFTARSRQALARFTLGLASRGFRRAPSAVAVLPFADELGELEPLRGHVCKHRLRRTARCTFSQGQAIGRTPAVPVGSGCDLALHADNPPTRRKRRRLGGIHDATWDSVNRRDCPPPRSGPEAFVR